MASGSQLASYMYMYMAPALLGSAIYRLVGNSLAIWQPRPHICVRVYVCMCVSVCVFFDCGKIQANELRVHVHVHVQYSPTSIIRTSGDHEKTFG